MKYEEPNLEILMLQTDDVVTSSKPGLQTDDQKNDQGSWDTIFGS